MPELTRRRSTDAREECWHIYYGDIHAGTIAIRTGSPHDQDPWEWCCGFYPGSHPGEHQSDTAATFDGARRFRARVAGVFIKPIFGHGAMREIGPNGNWASPPIVFRMSLRQGVRHAPPRGRASCACAAHHGEPKLCDTFRTNGTRPRVGRVGGHSDGTVQATGLVGERRPEQLTGIFRARSCDNQYLTAPAQHVGNESVTHG
jgi:hypothetical protein